MTRFLVAGAVTAINVGLAVAIGVPSPRPTDILEQYETAMLVIPPPLRSDRLSVRFTLCDGPIHVNCVVDGDTFWFRGDKIRIADIDAPEIFSPRCRSEKQIGEIARDRLLVLLNAGGFTLVSGWRDTDRYGRKLRTVTRAARSLGETLVEEGLARRWNEPRRDGAPSIDRGGSPPHTLRSLVFSTVPLPREDRHRRTKPLYGFGAPWRIEPSARQSGPPPKAPFAKMNQYAPD